MRRREVAAFLAGAALLAAVTGCSRTSAAQVNCEMIPAGPARTDCYIGLSRINRQKAGIAADIARQQRDITIYRNVTGVPLRKIKKRSGARVRVVR